MRPRKPAAEQNQDDLFRSRLDAIIDPRHRLVRLARAINWSIFDEAFEPLYDDKTGAPGLPTRLMVGLHMIKHMDGISDELVCARFLDSPYVQHFCGEVFFQHELTLDRSSMTNWRKRIGAEALEALLAESLAAAVREGALTRRHMERITIDTTVQEKNVAHPTDTRLTLTALQALVRLANQKGIKLRQTYARTAKWAALRAGRLLQRGRHKAGLREIKWLKTRLGRVIRDIERKIADNAALQDVFAVPLGRAETIRTQKAGGPNRLYSFHAPEVECIAKGKAHKRYEFGVKVSVAVTNALAPGGLFVLGSMAVPGNPYDGHTLAKQLHQTARITGVIAERSYVDQGYKGHDAPDKDKVFITRQKHGLTPTIKRELKRRSAVEPVIGHLKEDGHMGRCFLKCPEGDAVNTVLAAVGHNLRLLARWLSLFIAWIRLWNAHNNQCSGTLTA